ncbi:hypothetical protein RHSIM_Rhsim06G0143300 [Rhododendron simsii]|uniref:Uncharacterized protein n=1 Tax=Rhododendron simsii TaxID=118357 RepID=A0A834GT21_RHOSS|nr:hypothetical protein RHSIM_Rhsim06G0143300 [Rhododendron simsii]
MHGESNSFRTKQMKYGERTFLAYLLPQAPTIVGPNMHSGSSSWPLDELHSLQELSTLGFDKQAEALEDALGALLDALTMRRLLMGRLGRSRFEGRWSKKRSGEAIKGSSQVPRGPTSVRRWSAEANGAPASGYEVR